MSHHDRDVEIAAFLFSGALKKKLGLTLTSATEERGRVYRIVAVGA